MVLTDEMGLMTTGEVAKYLRLREETVIRKVKAGDLPATRMGRQFRFHRDRINDWVMGHASNEVKVLVVDDDPNIGALFSKTLGNLGLKRLVTTSSLEAIRLVEEERPEIAFIDLKMPVLDGPELLSRLTVIDKNLKVVVITGYPESELLDRALEYGPCMVLKKPFKPRDISRAVSSLIRVAR